ncbi:MAG: hypothetical protein EOO63_17470 [Hymenobacter sp.]|nr:MAG: hypothetical protein EOO63_17470 [Hymenobacter sp.]
MIRDVVSLAFSGATMMLLGALAFAGGLPFYPQFLLLYSLAFLFVILIVYAGAHWLRLRPLVLYVISTLLAAGGIALCLAWVLKKSLGQIVPLTFLLLSGTVLLPYLVANMGAYWLVIRNKG